MKTQHQKYLERLEQLLLDMDEEAIPHFVRMLEILAQEHKKKPMLRLVVA